MIRFGLAALALGAVTACAAPATPQEATTSSQSAPSTAVPEETPTPIPNVRPEGPPAAAMPQVSPGDVAGVADGAEDACGASRHQHLIGKTEAEARAANLRQPFRILCHNCPATMDYAPDRLNVILDPIGRVAEVSCG